MLRSLPHAAAMAGMAWMLYVMDHAMSGGSGTSGAGDGGHAGDGPRRWLGPRHDVADRHGDRAAAAVFAVFFLACALRWLARGFDGARLLGPGTRRPGGGHFPDSPDSPEAHEAYDLLCHGVMALGSAVMFVLLV
ncbi:DUF5134 domain-containing protein [Streptomyces sp. M19]